MYFQFTSNVQGGYARKSVKLYGNPNAKFKLHPHFVNFKMATLSGYIKFEIVYCLMLQIL